MSEFNRMTVVAAAEVISAFSSHSDMEILEVEWELAGRYATGSKSARVAGLAKFAIEENGEVVTESGRVGLARALVERAITAPPGVKSSDNWRRLVAGLRFDGFEIAETQTEIDADHPWGSPQVETSVQLVRMLPSDVPGLEFREAESEIEQLLDRHGFTVAKGHLKQAVSAFSRGEWASANGALRNLYESYLNEIADRLGYTGTGDSKAKRDFLGALQPPFLLADYNEWNANNQKPQFVQGLMSRMHPHGGHPGLSEEEDATFRLQINLVTARLFLRRFDQRSG
ncbi:hypothetical protein [Roseitalea porphyridii]|uniref:Uncharacterized protein n=1 Tax=Roseitalea porphyridii TaxID=1852022 RepID=A0A4P6UXL9_9HYPH|nr:hypothetical protein [Roseitalea porphyridii]QBK29782.1 hypothetical protein E0E05_03705 [Roseitalea porphyridii]